MSPASMIPIIAVISLASRTHGKTYEEEAPYGKGHLLLVLSALSILCKGGQEVFRPNNQRMVFP